ncbi:MAG: hypothetical protein OHK93_002642 [Ramalina farinacea]|uniref:Peroxisomal membrane protein 4 n=1 Tax=Ramalina farinacea TaxID=258253 RepID=A0AA43TXD1_9LECA|nr:hypothetical protein [Ramalina farinacea]
MAPSMERNLRSKLQLIYRATRTHARNLATFAVLYKSTMLLLRRTAPHGKEEAWHTFIAGLTGGYFVFGKGIQSSVNQQIVIYVFARVVLACAKLAVAEGRGVVREMSRNAGGDSERIDLIRRTLKENAWPVFAAGSWAAVMWLFRWYPETLQPSLRSSMQYM